MSTVSRDAARRKAESRWRPKPVTIAILAVVTVVVLGLMLVAYPPLGIWPFKSTEVITVKPGSTHADGLKVAIVGAPVVSTAIYTDVLEVQATVTTITETVRTVTITVQITNDVMQSPPVSGTPTPGAPTAVPEPARIINASVKVLYYDRPVEDEHKQIVGSGIGNYYDEDGLAPGESATIEVVGTDIGEFQSYEAFADGLWTDKDPVKTPEPLSSLESKRPAEARLPSLFTP